MKSDKTAAYLAPAIAARVVAFQNNGDLDPVCLVEHIDSGASIAIVYQESDDGQNWTDIAGTAATILPGGSDRQEVKSLRSRIALKAGGNQRFMFSVSRQVNGSPTDLGSA